MKDYQTNIDTQAIAIVGFVVAAFVTAYIYVSIGRAIYLITGVLVAAVCLFWIGFGTRLSFNAMASIAENRRLYLILNFMFATLLLLSVIAFMSNSDQYARPAWYFFVVAGMSGVLSFEIAFTMKSRFRIWAALTKIIVVGLNIVLTQSFLFPSVLGVDPWWHQMFTNRLMESGQIPEGYLYSRIPFFHVEVASAGILLDIDYKISALLSVGVFQIVFCVLSAYLLGSILLSKRVGALAALLVVTSSYFLSMGLWTIPNTLGTALIPFILYLVVRSWKKDAFAVRGEALLFILMMALILTHTVAAGGLAICLFVGWLSSELYSWIRRDSRFASGRYRTAIPFTVGMFGWWTFASGSFSILVFLIQTGFGREPFQIAPAEVISYASTVPDLEQVVGWLGLSLFFSLSIIGCIYMLSRKAGTLHTFGIATIGLCIMAAPFISMITGHRIYEHRFWYLALTILCVPLALSLFMLLSPLRRRFSKGFLMSGMVSIIVLLMIISPTANIDNSTFTPNSTVRFALTESELETIHSIGELNVSTKSDFYYSIALYWSGVPAQSMDYELMNANFTVANGTIILLRDEILRDPFWLYGTTWRLSYDPRLILDSQSFSKSFDCGTVVGYQRIASV